jgi:hypothetical protein
LGREGNSQGQYKKTGTIRDNMKMALNKCASIFYTGFRGRKGQYPYTPRYLKNFRVRKFFVENQKNIVQLSLIAATI